MKNAVKILLCLLLTAMTLSSACASGVQSAAQLVELSAMEHYPSYACDAETGKWSVHAYQADALMERFWDYGMRSGTRAVVFHLAAEGDRYTGVWSPVLRFYHIDGGKINARAVSILVDGTRYDLAASSASVVHNRHTAECITVPLNAEGMQVAAAMQQAEKVTVRLIGDELYTLTVNRNASSDRQALEGASLKGLASGMALLQELGADSYALWDLSADAWENQYGYRPAAEQAAVSDTLLEKRMTDSMGMILPDASSEAAVAAQEALIEHGFLSGSAYWKYNDQAVQATLRAQKYLGRVPTGCFDASLLDALTEGRREEAAAEPELYELGATAQLGLNRYWFADGISASANPDSLRSVANADNVFLAADGLIRNLSVQELHLFMQLDASVVYNSQYAYDAELVCECSDSTALDTRLLPLAQARLMVYAEIPAALAQNDEAQWSIVFTCGNDSLTFELQ